ncbi:hypothetical protein D3C78_951120 [compost metagenome]
MHIENDVAVIGQHALAVHRVAAELDQLARHVAAGHGDHFDRQREGTQHRHQLAGVGDADEGLGHGGNDLLAGQGRATALDQVQVLVAFVGAVDVELQVADGVQLIHRNTMTLQACSGRFGTGHGAVEGGLVLGQGVDEAVGGRTGADADDALVVELGQNEIDSGLGDSLFELVLGHAGSEAGRSIVKARSIAAKTPDLLWSPDRALG